MEAPQTDFRTIEMFCSRLQKEFLTCSICMQGYETPKVLGCNHTFCRKCLAVYIPKNTKTNGTEQGFDCPICRRFIPAPSSKTPTKNWVDLLQTNFVFLSMQDMISQSTGQHNPHHSTTTHRFKEDPVQKLNKRFSNLTCATHHKELGFYCISHDVVLCCDCAQISHKLCKSVMSCKDASAEMIGTIPEITQSATTCGEIVTELKSEIGTQLNALSESRSVMRRDINSAKEELIKKLHDLERKMLSELDTMHDECRQVFEERMFQCDMILASSKEALETLSDTKQCSANEIVKHMVDRKSTSQAEELLYKDICTKTQETELSFELSNFFRNILKTEKFGDLGTVMSPLKLPKGALMYTPHQRDMSVCDSALTGYTIAGELDAHTPGDKKYCSITGVTFLKDDRIVLMDGSNEKLKLFSASLEFLNLILMNATAFDVTSCGECEVAVSLPVKERVQFFNVEKNSLKISSREIDAKQACHGLTHGLGKLFVCCLRKKKLSECVKIFNENDDLVNHICSPLFTSLSSSYISLCPKENLLAVVDHDSDKHMIISFTTSGEIKNSIPLPFWRDSACGVVFHRKSLLVALHNRTLCIIPSPQLENNQLKEMESKKAVEYPNALAVSHKMDKIAVSRVYPSYNSNNNILQILTPEY